MRIKSLAITFLLFAGMNLQAQAVYNEKGQAVPPPGQSSGAEAFAPVDDTVSSKQADNNLIFPRGKEAKSEHYTGRIFITPGIHKAGYDINHLVFEAGSHNDWHIHPDADQLMLVLDGEGYYQEEGKPKQLVRKGDVVNTPANVKHWHGATPGSRLVHLSITGRTDKGHIQWLETVTAVEYSKTVDDENNQ